MASLLSQNGLVTLELALTAWWREVREVLPLHWQGFFTRHWQIYDAQLPVSPDLPLAMPVPSSAVLIRHLELPLASRFQLANLMRFEAARHVPLPLDQVRLDFRIVTRDPALGRMGVELAIIRIAAVEACVARARTANLLPEGLAIPAQGGFWFARRPLRQDWRAIWLHPRRLRLAWRIAAPLLILLLWTLAAQSWAGRLADDRAATVVAARHEAAGIAPLRQNLTATSGKLAYLAALHTHPSAAAVTEEVARLLPDDAWLQELDMEGQTVRLRGTAQHATDLLRIFSASPMFHDVKFDAGLTTAMGNQGDQFALVMTHD